MNYKIEAKGDKLFLKVEVEIWDGMFIHKDKDYYFQEFMKYRLLNYSKHGFKIIKDKCGGWVAVKEIENDDLKRIRIIAESLYDNAMEVIEETMRLYTFVVRYVVEQIDLLKDTIRLNKEGV